MGAGALWENKNQGEDCRCEDCSRSRAADLEPAVGDRLVEQIAERRAEWPSEYKSGPEQEDARHVREVIDRSKE